MFVDGSLRNVVDLGFAHVGSWDWHGRDKCDSERWCFEIGDHRRSRRTLDADADRVFGSAHARTWTDSDANTNADTNSNADTNADTNPNPNPDSDAATRGSRTQRSRLSHLRR